MKILSAEFLFAQNPSVPIMIASVIGLIALIVFLAIFARFFSLWIQCKTTGAGIGLWDLIGMWFRKVDPKVITRCKIMAVQAGLGEETGSPVKCSKRTIWHAATCLW